MQRRDTQAGRRWDVRLRDPSGRVYNRTFRTRQEAIAFERAELSARDQVRWVDPRAGRQTVAEWVEHWFPAHEQGLAPNTRSQYRSTINRRILPALGHRRLESITPLDIQRLVNDWSDGAKPLTVHHRFAVLRTVFRAAIDPSRSASHRAVGKGAPASSTVLASFRPSLRWANSPPQPDRSTGPWSGSGRCWAPLG